MKLTFWTRLNSSKTNTRVNIRNLPTQILLDFYQTKSRSIVMRTISDSGYYKYALKRVPLSRKQHRAVRDVLRVRLLPRGVFIPQPEA